jgi:hypothetical protein
MGRTPLLFCSDEPGHLEKPWLFENPRTATKTLDILQKSPRTSASWDPILRTAHVKPPPGVLGLAVQEKELHMSPGSIAQCLLPAVFMILVPSSTLSAEPREGSSSSQYPLGATAASSLRANVRLRGIAGRAVERAVLDASRRLAAVACQKVLSDFVDASGKPLQASLDALGETAQGYLSRVLFYDGSSQMRCSTGMILGGTTRGSRIVYVCASQFSDRAGRNASDADAFVIHEMLHTLGLGENPPAPSQITAQVMQRCY